MTAKTELATGAVSKKIPKIRAKMPSTRISHQGYAVASAAFAVLVVIVYKSSKSLNDCLQMQRADPHS